MFFPIIFNKQVDSLLPPQTEVSMKFNRLPTNLCLLGDNKTEYKIKIWTAKLVVERVKMIYSAFNHLYRIYSCEVSRILFIVFENLSVSKGNQNVD